MKKLFAAVLWLSLCVSGAVAVQNTNSSGGSAGAGAVKAKRGPIFRATKEQIKQAQTILKQRGFYSGEAEWM